jgi:glycosyltransferase involved in cell wall biosynthesis
MIHTVTSAKGKTRMASTVSVNARFLTQSTTGVQRYAQELVKALDGLIDRGLVDIEKTPFLLVAPQDVKYELGLRHIPLRRVGRFRGHLWEQLELPYYTRGSLLVCLASTGPLFRHQQMVAIHDATVFASPQTFSFAFRTWYKLLQPSVGKVAKRVITCSSFSKKELRTRCRIAEDKIRVIGGGAEHISAVASDEAILRKHELKRKGFVLAVSSHLAPNKNFHSIARASELLGDTRLEVVIVGGSNAKVSSPLPTPLPANVKYIGYVSDGELRALYENAACFVFPSFYEGFGIPPLEAMACGCPVIVSAAASLPEVCEDAALYCDPHSPKDIADKIWQLTNDTRSQTELRQRGIERARHFSWGKSARELAAVIEEVLEE